MSASLVVDLNGTCQSYPSLNGNQQQAAAQNPSGQLCGLSGIVIGQSVDLLNADTFCNVYVAGTAIQASGALIIGIQTSDSDVSGTYTDPTSGLAQLPTVVQSGGNIWINSGSTGGIYGSGTSGQFVQSGFMAFAAFQRVGRFARLLFNSGFFLGNVTAGFISNLRTTGSGGGFSLAPSSGVVNV